ncbi:MAG: hypothetical protein R6U41_03820 [Desulfosalsimonas sp.]|uniref:hypothetical protein n=1 Tax=Desulfosalsimonas sp. TaxID=3073848 RepID=UPI003970DF2E
MRTIKWLGMLSFLGGLVLVGFQAIASIMDEGQTFYNHTLASVFGHDAFTWIESFPVAFLRSYLDSLVTAPLYIVLLCAGGVLLVINGLFAKS